MRQEAIRRGWQTTQAKSLVRCGAIVSPDVGSAGMVKFISCQRQLLLYCAYVGTSIVALYPFRKGLPMNNRIRQLLDQINTLEEELHTAIEEQESRFRYKIEGRRVTFENAIRDAHRRLKMGVFHWLLTSRPRNFLTIPVIYAMIVPLVLFDLCVTFYQATCFPIFGIAKVCRADYIVVDHQHLAYLNVIEKMHCIYCSYAVGLLGYAAEITARTEQYFCPIKHAHKMLGANPRYERFLGYGEADDYQRKLEEFRAELAKEAEQADRPQNDDAAG